MHGLVVLHIQYDVEKHYLSVTVQRKIHSLIASLFSTAPENTAGFARLST